MVMKLDPVMVLLDRLLLDRFQNFFSLHFNHFVKKISRHVCSQTFMLHQQSSSLSTVVCLHFLPLSATSQVLLPWLVVGLSKGNLANEFSIRLVWPIILRQCHCYREQLLLMDDLSKLHVPVHELKHKVLKFSWGWAHLSFNLKVI